MDPSRLIDDILVHFTLNHESGTLATGKPHAVIRDLEDFQTVFAWVQH